MLEALIAGLDPDVRAAIADVDVSLIELALDQTPMDRLRSATRLAQWAARLSDAQASSGS